MASCRSLDSARNELRWIQDHAKATSQTLRPRHVEELCRRRGRGVPLQYVLESQPFGHLDIRCSPGVLIPRPETEAYTCHLAHLIKTGEFHDLDLQWKANGLGIVDICTGTGCIPLLLFASLQSAFTSLRVHGVDIAQVAVDLARHNIRDCQEKGHIVPSVPGQSLDISLRDIFDDADMQGLAGSRWDILVANPPYISQRSWFGGNGQLQRSVRQYEPQLALVPGHHLEVPPTWQHEDVFYFRLFNVATWLKPSIILLEIGDEAQARRVLRHFYKHPLAVASSVELWRDWPDVISSPGPQDRLNMATHLGQTRTISIKGSGNIRSIFIKRRLC
ncbi:hypothetical protein CDD82_704 [Ophiocordyceps australis]|uniref:Methyltransferase small domain-containing protein n=1 Tax=Ophiocordyceps australis TaxID=1399860 RepID=A0A2C5ZNS0_9HYPO|nr:hypothetical protein CDD82_704 [Ophiocordyceps australis]